MPKLSTYTQSPNAATLVFGLPKSGKTELVGNLAEHFNLLWFDLENGFETLLKMPEEWQDRVNLIRIPDSTVFPIAIETCLKVIKGKVSVCHEHGKVGCPICRKKVNELSKDNPDQGDEIEESFFTEIDLHNLDENTIVVFDSSTQLTASAIAHITKKMPDDYKLEWDDWGSLSRLMEIFFSYVQNAPHKTIVISHVTEAELATGKHMLVPVAGSNKFSSNVAKYFGHVVYCEIKNKKHRAASATDYMNNILTGSRTNVRLEDAEGMSLLGIYKPDAVPEEDRIKTPPSDSQVADKKLSSLKDRIANK